MRSAGRRCARSTATPAASPAPTTSTSPRYRLAEGERLIYWLELTDNDTVSGPKRASSATQTVKIYSEAEHHQAALAKAQRLWEEMVGLLGDRLAFFDENLNWTAPRVGQASALDARTRILHEGLRTAAGELKKDRAAPPQLAPALSNIAASIRSLEQNLTAVRASLSRMVSFQQPGLAALLGRLGNLDSQLDRELEKDILYLEELFDKQRADDLVKVAKDLAARRRDLASLLESYKQAPTAEKKKELLAEVSRLKARMQDMMRRMCGAGEGHQRRAHEPRGAGRAGEVQGRARQHGRGGEAARQGRLSRAP